MRSCLRFLPKLSWIASAFTLALSLVTPLELPGQTGLLYPIAGTGENGYSGNGGPATDAKLDAPMGVAVDQHGVVYIADYFNNVVRKVTPDGVISNFAGNGFGAFGSGCTRGCFGYSGDGGPATSAELSFPRDVVADDFGNVFIADSINNVIRKVNAEGIISTVAGNGFAAGAGYGSYSGDGGRAIDAELNFPTAIAVDSIGNLYIADSSNDVIRKVNVAGIISTVAGHVNYVCAYPCSLPVANNGDGGPATSAVLVFPSGVAVAPDGSLYISDTYDAAIRKVDAAGIISTVVGGGTHSEKSYVGPARQVSLSEPEKIKFDTTGNLYLTNSGYGAVQKVNPAGILSTIAGGGSPADPGDTPRTAYLAAPVGIALSRQGDVYIADPDENLVYRATYPQAVLQPIRRPMR